MPCCCGNTTCPCGIPCYCSDESCMCLDCAIALPRLCQICHKPLNTERWPDNGTCSCFMEEFASLIVENQDHPSRRMGNIPVPFGYFVSGKLIVNLMIPVLRFPHFIPQKPFCLMPPLTPIETDNRNSSFISGEDGSRSFCPPGGSGVPSTAEVNSFLEKSNGQSIDNGSSDYRSKCEQNIDLSRQKFRHSSPVFSESTEKRQSVNTEWNSKSETEECVNIQELTSFYLPSVMINNISYPVRMNEPVWRLPNPAVCNAGNAYSTINIFNPFYVAGPALKTQSGATYEKEFSPPAPSTAFGVKAKQCFTDQKDVYLQELGELCLQMKGQRLNLTKISDQSYSSVDEENTEFEVLHNASGNEGTAPLYTGNFNETPLTDQFGIPANCLKTDQPQPLSGNSTSASEKNDFFKFCPDSSDSVHRAEAWQKVKWRPPPLLTGAIPPILMGNLGTIQSSKLKKLFDGNSLENKCFPNDCPGSVSANKEEKLYIDPCTTEKMGKILKSTIKVNTNSPAFTENAAKHLDSKNFYFYRK